MKNLNQFSFTGFIGREGNHMDRLRGYTQA